MPSCFLCNDRTNDLIMTWVRTFEVTHPCLTKQASLVTSDLFCLKHCGKRMKKNEDTSFFSQRNIVMLSLTNCNTG